MDDDALWAVLSGLETDVSSMQTDLVWVEWVVYVYDMPPDADVKEVNHG